ncbi:MAG: hypothetical protein ABJL99_03825 [Aliishimia sp.]
MPSALFIATIKLTGDVNTPDFAGWIEKHARKLDVQLLDTQTDRAGVSLKVQGAEELVQALALGCSLGPASVMVEGMTLTRLDPF